MILAIKTLTYTKQLIKALEILIAAGLVTRVVYSCIQAGSDAESLAAALKKSKRIIYAGSISIVAVDFLNTIVVYMAGVQPGNKANTIAILIAKIFTDLSKTLIVIEAGLVLYHMIKEGILYQKAQDEEKGKHKSNMIKSLSLGIFAIVATSLIPEILKYYR